MTEVKFTWEQIEALNPCREGYSKAKTALARKRVLTVEKAVRAGVSAGDIHWVLERMAPRDKDIARRLVLWAADCAAHVLHIYERSNSSDAPRKAILYSRAQPDADADAAAYADADADARAARAYAAYAAYAAADAARAAADAATYAARDAAYAAYAAADAAAYAARAARADADAATYAARDAAQTKETAWQSERLVLWFSDKKPEPLPLP